MSDDLVTWLRARFDDDERVALAASPGPWRIRNLGRHDQSAIVMPGCGTTPMGLPIGPSIAHTYSGRGAADALHIGRHDPARVLREVEAKRRILDLTRFDAQFPDSEGGYDSACEDVIKLLAEVYADRPGYREEWRP